MPNNFKSAQAIEIINYIKEKYDGDLEFLWENSPDAAIWRNKANKKWYGIIMTISENKLGLKSDKKIEIINVKYQKGITNSITDFKHIFPAYHMNKQNWVTIALDKGLNTGEIFELIDNSYSLISQKAKRKK